MQPATSARPRPPAQVRRSTSSNFTGKQSPPPPYPLDFTFPSKPTKLSSFTSPARSSTDSDDAWLNETSQDDITELLLKATGLIKNRETEFDRSSALRKSLYDGKVTLQSRHQELVSRIPTTPTKGQSATSTPCITPLTHTPSHSFSGITTSIDNVRRVRRISVSPEDLSLLADQNAELMDKLERVEIDANTAELDSRRKLKKLEKELSLLREELEETQAKNSELEEHAKVDAQKLAQELEWRRVEREDRFKALRAGSGFVRSVDRESTETRDFAPGGPLSESQSFPTSSPARAAPVSSPKPSHGRSGSQTDLLAQLLKKIQELEDTNTNIIEEQRETAGRLESIQRETETMSKVYECLNDMDAIRLELDDQDSRIQDSYMDALLYEEGDEMEQTVRLRSLKKSIEGAYMLKSISEDISSDLDALGLTSFRKPRKSVFDLFGGEMSPASTGHPHPSLHVPFANDAWKGASDASPLNITERTASSPGWRHGTLQSEMGEEYDDSWRLNAPNFHLKSSSLYDISQLQLASPSPSRPLSMAENKLESGPNHPSGTINGPVGSILQLTLEPPTPPQNDTSSCQADQRSWRSRVPGTPTERYTRMSQTVRSRTNRWVDSRFGDTIVGPKGSPDSRDATITSSTAMVSAAQAKLMDTLQSNVDQVLGKEKERKSSSQQLIRKDRQGLSKLMMELWVWLQFAVIILLFLYTVARRGPRSIIREADGRRVAQAVR